MLLPKKLFEDDDIESCHDPDDISIEAFDMDDSDDSWMMMMTMNAMPTSTSNDQEMAVMKMLMSMTNNELINSVLVSSMNPLKNFTKPLKFC